MAGGTNSRVFHYHADASPFGGIVTDSSGNIRPIPTQGSASLSDAGGPAAGSSVKFSHPLNISVDAASSTIDGSQSTTSPNPWVTTVTSCVEGLNIADRIKADEIICTMTTEHPSSGSDYDPAISFGKCTYKNLKVDGQAVVPDVQSGVYQRSAANVSAAPGSWLQNIDMLCKVGKQMSVFSGSSVPADLKSRYKWVASANDRHAKGHVVCSLVQGFTGSLGSMTPYGHVLVVPGFGRLFFGELRVYHCAFNLTMLRVEIETDPTVDKSGISNGTMGVASARTNASSSP